MNCISFILVMKSLVFLGLFYSCYGIVYDRYRGTPSTQDDLLRYAKLNTTFWCTVDIEPCDPKEGRRVDGSCNNLDNPVRGAGHTPFNRFLPEAYSEGFGIRKALSGGNLPPARLVRTNCLADGRVSSQTITHLAMDYLLFFSDGVSSLHDITNYVLERDCCSEEGKKDPQCIPSIIPDDDPVFRFSNERCLNLTIPKTFQTFGCIENTTFPSRIVFNTPINDLVSTYGYSKSILETYRLLEGGQLRYEVDENGKIWPPSTKTAENACILNEGPTETRCHDARRENLEKEGVISKNKGYRKNIYDPKLLPQLYLEYLYVLRYFHTIQEGEMKLYDTDGTFVKKIPIGNLTLRTGYFADGDNMVYLTQGTFRQPSAAPDQIVDPYIGNLGLGPTQKALDITTSDLSKGRYFFFPSYTKYIELFNNVSIKCWDDLKGMMRPENIEKLKNTYEHVNDVDLLAGIWMEEPIPGGMVPISASNVIVHQLREFVRSDRHHYERPDRPHSFTLDQLLEIRKMSIARILCDNGDSVSEIQPNAFLRIGPGNQLVHCSEIKQMDYSMWKDDACSTPADGN